MSGRSRDGTLTLVGMALRQTTDHIGKTLALARVEIDGNLRALFGLLAPFALCALLILSALFVWLGALVKALTALTGSEALSALVVAAPFLAVATVLVTLALRRMSPREE
jgi:hypothetical protein